MSQYEISMLCYVCVKEGKDTWEYASIDKNKRLCGQCAEKMKKSGEIPEMPIIGTKHSDTFSNGNSIYFMTEPSIKIFRKFPSNTLENENENENEIPGNYFPILPTQIFQKYSEEYELEYGQKYGLNGQKYVPKYI